MIHFHLIDAEEVAVEATLTAAAERGMKVIMSANPVYDREAHVLDTEKLDGLVERWRGHAGLYGFVLEASYVIPLDDQQLIYDAFKRAETVATGQTTEAARVAIAVTVGDGAGGVWSVILREADSGSFEDNSIRLDNRVSPILSLSSEHVFRMRR